MPGGLMGARVVGGSTIRAAGLQGQACAVFQAARRLSVRRWPALLGGASTLAAAATAAGAGACPPQAEDIVAMGAFALVGLLVPLAAAWLVEVSYRTRFARSHGLLSVARGPAALHWPAARRFSVVESAIVAGGVLFISALDLFSDFYLT
jgi:predicted RND superfamily exporter protein